MDKAVVEGVEVPERYGIRGRKKEGRMEGKRTLFQLLLGSRRILRRCRVLCSSRRVCVCRI